MKKGNVLLSKLKFCYCCSRKVLKQPLRQKLLASFLVVHVVHSTQPRLRLLFRAQPIKNTLKRHLPFFQKISLMKLLIERKPFFGLFGL